jgi:hypothetical protein
MRAGALPFALILLLPLAGGGQNATETGPIEILVSRLTLPRYKATIRGLTRFGRRRQGTDRNRAALHWIEEQLRSCGCADTERIRYTCEPKNAIGRFPQ